MVVNTETQQPERQKWPTHSHLRVEMETKPKNPEYPIPSTTSTSPMEVEIELQPLAHLRPSAKDYQSTFVIDLSSSEDEELPPINGSKPYFEYTASKGKQIVVWKDQKRLKEQGWLNDNLFCGSGLM